MNRLHHFSIFLTLVPTIFSCGRTTSEERFELSTQILIPNNVEVLTDEYQDMIQDYAIDYSIKLTPLQLVEISNSIRNSELFNPNILGTEITEQEWFQCEHLRESAAGKRRFFLLSAARRSFYLLGRSAYLNRCELRQISLDCALYKLWTYAR